MQYDDEAVSSVEQIEEMAKAYSGALKEKGFVFVGLEEEGKMLLLKEVFDILFKLRASYRYLGNFLSSMKMLSLTEKHIDELRGVFNFEKNRGHLVATNRTKCFLNSVALENLLSVKLLLLSQKTTEGDKIVSMLIERQSLCFENLEIQNAFRTV